MASFTLTQLRDQVRRLGHYENSTAFTSAFLNEWINKGLEEYHEVVADSFEGYLDKVDASLVTVSGTQTVALPSDFYRLRALDKQLGTYEHVPLRHLSLLDSYRFQGQGSPAGYMLFGGTTNALPGRIRLFPVPDAVYTLRLTYVPTFTALVSDADTATFLPNGDEFVVYAALVHLDERDERNPAVRMQQRDAAKARLVGAAARRDSGEPEYLIPRHGYTSEED